MQKLISALAIATAFFLCTACSTNATDDSDDSERQKTGYERALDKAHNVEDQLQEASERRKRDIDKQEGGG